jgi:hypothetical protein
LTPESVKTLEIQQEKLRQRFVKFPYLTGMTVAKKCKIPILAVLLELMWQSYSHRGRNPVTLPSAGLGISRGTKRRVLYWLENAGAIKVTQRKGKNPLVQLNWLPPKG